MTGTDGDRERLEALERENRELRRANEFLPPMLALALSGSGTGDSGAFPSMRTQADEGAR